MSDKITTFSELKKAIDVWQKRLKTFNMYRESKYSMFTTRTVNFDKYCEELKKLVYELEKNIKKREKSLRTYSKKSITPAWAISRADELCTLLGEEVKK